MSERDHDALDRDLAALLEPERRAEAPQQRVDRVWARLAVSVVPVPHVHGWAAGKVTAVAIGAFIAGGAVGAALHARLAAPAAAPTVERIVYVDRPPAPPPSPPPTHHATETPLAPTAPATPASSVAPPSASGSGARPTASAPRASAVPHAAPASSLAAERAILDDARAALVSGDPARALALTDEHARGFAKPQLAEEREAIAIQALVALGRYDEARARAARFRAASPQSLFLPAIDTTLQSIP